MPYVFQGKISGPNPICIIIVHITSYYLKNIFFNFFAAQIWQRLAFLIKDLYNCELLNIPGYKLEYENNTFKRRVGIYIKDY